MCIVMSCQLRLTFLHNIQLFKIIDEISYIIRARTEMPPDDTVSLEVSLINLAHKCYLERVD